MTTITLYGRPGCHLCEIARERLERVRERHPFELREVDIERDPALLREMLERIPVVHVDGAFLCELELDERALAQRLAAASVDA